MERAKTRNVWNPASSEGCPPFWTRFTRLRPLSCICRRKHSRGGAAADADPCSVEENGFGTAPHKGGGGRGGGGAGGGGGGAGGGGGGWGLLCFGCFFLFLFLFCWGAGVVVLVGLGGG